MSLQKFVNHCLNLDRMGAYCPALCKNTRLVEAVVVVVLLLQISSFLITCTSRSPSRVMNAIYGGGTTLAGRREEASVHSPCSQERRIGGAYPDP